jgi:ribosomal protein L16 Arg81 hydroxylase
MHYKRAELGAPSLDKVLTAGDALYIPMGWPHHGRAGEVGSLHNTYQLLPSEDPD